MKLLITIAALALSFSVFSQDLIEYNDGQFSRAGNTISFEDVEQLTKDYKVGFRTRVLLNEGIKANKRANNRLHRNSVAVITTGMGGLASYGYFLMSDFAKQLDWRVLQNTFYGIGVVMIPSTALLAINFSRQEFWINQRDDAFTRLAERLNNTAIQSQQ